METIPLLAIFDSGVGGFSVLREVKKVTTSDILYFGDCKRAPYGNKKEEEIVVYIRQMLAALKAEGATHFVSACNSMSVLTTSQLLKECDIEEHLYVDMIRAFKEHATFPQGSQVLIAGTKATITSGEYQNFLISKNLQAYTYTFPDLAQKIEEGKNEALLYNEIRESFVLAQFVGATHYVYGCTHYPLISHVFETCAKEIGWNGIFIDPAVFVAEKVKKWNLVGERRISFETSLETETFTNYVRESFVL